MTSRMLYLMRHGEPLLTGRMLGSTDCDATSAGIAACRAQVQALFPSHVIASDLRRATQCAAAVAGDLGVPVRIDPRWRELDFGEWDGVASSAIDREALGRFWNDPDGCPPPGGERWSELVERVESAIAALPGDPVLVVTHGGAMRAALHLLCGIALPQLWAFDLPYASVLGIRLWEGSRPGERIMGQIVELRP